MSTPVKIYVGNLSWHTTDDGLHEAFKPFGTVHDHIVMKDRETGRSRGFGFVTYASQQEADAAIQNLHESELDGRRIRVNMANTRNGGGGGYGGGYGGQSAMGGYGGGYAGHAGQGGFGGAQLGFGGQQVGFGGYQGAQAGFNGQQGAFGAQQGGFPGQQPGAYGQQTAYGQQPQGGYGGSFQGNPQGNFNNQGY